MAQLIIAYTTATNEDGSTDETVQDLLTGFPTYEGQTVEEHPYEELILVDLGDRDDTSVEQEEWLNKTKAIKSYYVEAEQDITAEDAAYPYVAD